MGSVFDRFADGLAEEWEEEEVVMVDMAVSVSRLELGVVVRVVGGGGVVRRQLKLISCKIGAKNLTRRSC